jgi:hypothetical protein
MKIQIKIIKFIMILIFNKIKTKILISNNKNLINFKTKIKLMKNLLIFLLKEIN